MVAATETTTRMTADEFFAFAAKTEARCELIEGEVRVLSPTGFGHGAVTSRLAFFICHHVYENDLGVVAAAETGFRLDDHGKPTVRAPDIAFVRQERAAQANTPKFAPIPPDLAVETNSPDDSASYVREKVRWWLGHGVREVWVVDPPSMTLTLHRPDGTASTFERDETFRGSTVLPGLVLPLPELFR